VIYLDNAATSFPKPPEVAHAIARLLTESAGNPGRSGHGLALAAERVVEDARRRLAALFGVADPARIAFTLNATDALNLALWGLLAPGDRVVTTSVEHNAVVRPLHALAATRGVVVERAACAPDGSLDLDDLTRVVARAKTRLVVVNHASNVVGTVLPVREAAAIAHAHGAAFLLDAAQTAGVLPIDVRALGVDLLAFPGHKGLLGPTGTGGLYVAPGVRLTPLRQGGTGTRSEDERHPEEMPQVLEAGTPNTVGIAGLGAAVAYLEARGVADVRAHELARTGRLLAGLGEIPGVRVHGPLDPTRRVSAVSITLAGWEPNDVAAVLDGSFGIAVRAGLHCAPLAHRTIGTFPRGTVRLSPGPFTTEAEIDGALAALRSIAGVSGP